MEGFNYDFAEKEIDTSVEEKERGHKSIGRYAEGDFSDVLNKWLYPLGIVTNGHDKDTPALRSAPLFDEYVRSKFDNEDDITQIYKDIQDANHFDVVEKYDALTTEYNELIEDIDSNFDRIKEVVANIIVLLEPEDSVRSTKN